MLSGGREDPPYPRPAEPIDARPADSPALPDSADERGAIGENLCQPPLLPLLSRAGVEPPELPDLVTDPAFEPVFPGRATSRVLPVLPSCRLAFETCDGPRADELAAVAVLPRAEKKC